MTIFMYIVDKKGWIDYDFGTFYTTKTKTPVTFHYFKGMTNF